MTDIATARQALGKDAIIGATACSVEEAHQAVKNGADYLGVGTVFPTPTQVSISPPLVGFEHADL